MPLAQEDFNEVTEYVKENIISWLSEYSFDIDKSSILYRIDLRERMIRLEEELKHQRELMHQGFELVNIRGQEQSKDMNTRFEEQREDMIQRFEKVDQRFEEQREDMIQRFEKVDWRFEEQRKDINQRFEEQREDMIQRFEKVDRRFEKIDQRFEEQRKDMNTRFEEQGKRMDKFMVWSFGMIVTAVAIIISAIKYL